MHKWNKLNKEEKTLRHNLQLSLEEDLLDYSTEKYWSAVHNDIMTSAPEQDLIKEFVLHSTKAFERFQEELATSSTRTGDWAAPLMIIPPDVLCAVVISQLIYDLIDARDLRQKIYSNGVDNAHSVAFRIGREICLIAGFRQAKLDNSEDYAYLKRYVKSWTPKKMNRWTNRMKAMPTWTKKQKLIVGTNLMHIARHLGVISIETKVLINKNNRGGRQRYNHVKMDPDIMLELIAKHEQYQFLKMIYRPMITPPVPHELESAGGVLTMERRKPTVGGISTPSQEHIDSLNTLQTTEWSVNKRVMEVMRTLFQQNEGQCNMPSMDYDQFIFTKPYPEEGDGQEKYAWKKEKEEKYANWYKEVQKRAQMYVRLDLAKKMSKIGFFYHAHTCDFRGRAYTLTEMLSPQSGDFDRGLIRFATPCKVTREGMYWLMVHVANACDGMDFDGDVASDKATFDDRVSWVKRQEKNLRNISEDPYGNSSWMDNETSKKNPSFQRLSAILDYVDALDTGLSYVPVQLDGSCNGSQHWSAIMRDEKIGALVNVIPTDTPGDLYQFVADIGTSIVKKAKNTWHEVFYEHWNRRIPRKVFKRSTMCDAYGITDHGIRRYCREEGHLDWVDDGSNKTQAVAELSIVIRSALNGALESSNDGKRFLQTLTQLCGSYQKHAAWTTPSGFRAANRYTQFESVMTRSTLYRNHQLAINHAVDTNDVDIALAIAAIPPNFIHSLDAAHMMLTVARMVQANITNYSMIHDSYGCPCNDVPVMRECINEEFHKIHKENQLALFAKDVGAKLGFDPQIPLPQHGALNIDGVLRAEYLFG